MHAWLRSVGQILNGPKPARKAAYRRLTLEALESRCLLDANVLQTNLVSDLPGVAQHMDPQLVNPWGISESAGSPFWISDNNAGVSTLYNTTGDKQGLVVSIPAPGDPLGASGTPTGTVFNTGLGTGAFKVSGVDKTGAPTSAPAIFLFATEDGTLVGWNPGVNPSGFDPAKAGTYAIIAVDNSTNPTAADGAVYKGLAIATSTTGPIFPLDPASTSVLYVSNFRAGHVEVYDTNFKLVTTFTDPQVAPGYAPFNVQVLGGKLYVTFALQDADRHDDVAGRGHGYVDVFNLDGSPGLNGGQERLITHGRLNSPWGLAIAPSSFGSLAGSLLVGNFGDGRINAYKVSNGAFQRNLRDPDGEPIVIDGLWALKVGNGGNGGDADKVYFTAGLFGERHGLFGSLTPVAKGSPEGPAEAQFAQGAIDVVQMDLTNLLNDIASGASQDTINQDTQTLSDDARQLARIEIALARDVQDDLGGSSLVRSHAKEPPAAALLALDKLWADLGHL
jgi:uncharacterized protein (TIGR03118 family)